MITFKHTDIHSDDRTQVVGEVSTTSDYLGSVLDSFKTFLLHVGHSPSNIERITFEEKQQGFPSKAPQQLELPL